MTLAPDQMICFSLYSATHAMQQVYRPLLDPLGLTYPQYLVLSALWATEGAPTVGDVSRMVALESSTLTPLLKRLEAMGHLTRRRDSADERKVRLHLTDQGRALQDEARHIPDCIAQACGMSLAALEHLQRDVNRLRDNLRGADDAA